MEGTINSELRYTLEDILPKFGEDMRRKIRHSVDLLRKSERLALAYEMIGLLTDCSKEQILEDLRNGTDNSQKKPKQ